MPDNLLKAVVDAIAESDNEIGGLLITRLREAHEFGRNNASVAAADPDRLVSPVDVFNSGMVGEGLDLLEAPVPTGNEGSYLIGTYVDAKNVDLVKIGDGAAATFVDESNVRWRFTTLRVETTWQFPSSDKAQALWVGDEPAMLPYGELVITPGAQEFRGIGEQLVRIDGAVRVAAPNTLTTVGEFFTSGMVGAAVWCFKKGTPTGNEGPRRITAFGTSRSVTVTNPAFTADEDDLIIAVKTYPRLGAGYLTQRKAVTYHRELAEVIDASRSYSALDQLRRSLYVDYATEEELDRVGGNLNVKRAKIMDDETYRRYIKARAYMPASTVQAFELALEALFPQGGWTVYEDLAQNPNKIYILDLPGQAPGSVSEGKTFVAPGTINAGPPETVVDPAGKGQREVQTSASASTVTVSHAVTSVVDVLLADYLQQLDMDVLPSAETPAWTFNTEGAGTPAEGAVFSVVNLSGTLNVLQQTVPGAPSQDGGNYTQVNTGEIDYRLGSVVEFGAWWRQTSLTTVNGRPWTIAIRHDGIDKEVFLRWSETDIALTDGAAAIPSGAPAAVTPNADIDDGLWHRFVLRIEIKPKGYFVRGLLDGQDLFGEVNLTLFSSTGANEFLFGYEDLGSSQSWTVQWDHVQPYARSTRNFFNRCAQDGTFTGTPSLAFNGSSFVAGDAGKLIRTSGYERSTNTFRNRNDGVWKIATYVGAAQVTLGPVTHGPNGTEDRATQGATVSGADTDITDTPDRPGARNGALITIPVGDAGVFRPEDGPSVLDDAVGGYAPLTGGSGDGKSIKTSGSTLDPTNNDVTCQIIEVIDSRTARVNHPNAAGFTTETGLTWEFDVNDFEASAAAEYEVIDKGSVVTSTITLGENLPSSSEEVHCWYTAVLSAQLLRNEFVTNEGSGGSAGNVWYPFYIFDIDLETRRLIEDVSAAGVIPQFQRTY